MKTLRIASLALSAALLTACGSSDDDPAAEADTQASTDRQSAQAERDGYDAPETASKAEARLVDGKVELSLPDGVTSEMMGERTGKMLAVQAMLDRTAHAPGVIDGFGGGNTDTAIRYFRAAHGMSANGGVDTEFLETLFDETGGDIFRTYTVTEKDVAGSFATMPEEFPEMAQMDKLGYESAAEMLAERFHMDQDFLKALNPDADFDKAGTKLVIVSHGDGAVDGDVAKIEVRGGEDRLVAMDDAGKILASYPATIGSTRFPSPSGTMKVSAVAPKPNYTFKGDAQEWGPEGTYILPPGPNNPVGGTWIDLSKDGYGIHGSPDPQLIGKTASHGCVRLTNWNAAALAKAVSQGVTVSFA